MGAEVGGIGAGVNGEAWAGFESSAQSGMGDDGRLHIGGSTGIGLGLGGKVARVLRRAASRPGPAHGDQGLGSDDDVEDGYGILACADSGAGHRRRRLSTIGS